MTQKLGEELAICGRGKGLNILLRDVPHIDEMGVVADIHRNVSPVQAGSDGQNLSVSTRLYQPTTEH